MDRFLDYVELLIIYSKEENEKLKKEIARDLKLIRNGYIPVKLSKSKS